MNGEKHAARRGTSDRSITAVWPVCVVVSCAVVTGVLGAAEARIQDLPQDAGVEVVEVVGCLSEGPFNTWILDHGTTPIASTDKSLTPEAITEAEAMPLGSEEYRLVVVSEYDPWAHLGHKVLIRGILTPEGSKRRINVTALRRASVNCAE